MVPPDSQASAVERSLVALTQEVETLRQAIATMRAGSSPAARAVDEIESELRRALALNEQLTQRADGAERRLADLLEGLITAVQAENARLALLIDTVQSSHFWLLKRWMGKFLGRRR